MLDTTARHKMMINKLKIQADNGRVKNQWTSDFIYTCDTILKEGRNLSEKQSVKLEEIFDEN